MSFCTWHIYGYGLCVNEVEGLKDCLKPEYRELFEECGKDWPNFFDEVCDDTIITVSDNGQGSTYIHNIGKYSWKMTPEEKEFKSVKDIEKYIINFLSKLCDTVPDNLPFRELDEEGWG